MPQRRVIPDSFKFAAEGRSLAGKVALADLPRLADLLVERAGELEYRLDGEVSADRKSRLRLSVSGNLMLQCQRCLGAMEWPLRLEMLFDLVRPGQKIPDEELEEDAYDAIEAVPDMDVLALVEDEIVLAVPIAPRHESCDAPRPEGGGVKESPFSALAGLRKKDSAS
ncbi:MAG TPA: YceD family protein [Aromatoleum sp.]|uniref:YceD family protein n=1 Tax=Aromatoleum sp. TaxID=2307007 RepID=UPI002B491E13|nr:YceD family protein [Aromatoleum sp.]HJV26129.1 YceD family protein [Aromatoleum sp.]